MKAFNMITTQPERLIAAPFTPFYADGSLNVDLIPAYYAFLKRNGNAGAFICGSTGEGPSLTMAEKISLTDAWAAAAKGDNEFRVIVFVGGNCLAECKQLAAHAANAGLFGFSMTAPSYFKPADLETLAACCIEVASAAPDLPFYYYHIPVLTGVRFPMAKLLKMLDGKIPNLAGIKYTDDDISEYTSCVNYANKKYEVMWGRDESLLGALAVGGRAGIGSTYNYAMPLYQKLISAFKNGDMETAAACQQQSIDMIALLGKYGGRATGKEFMRAVGIDCGGFRLPFRDMPKDLNAAFQEDLALIRFDELRSY
jgi:N-acetylneuraminate lyase